MHPFAYVPNLIGYSRVLFVCAAMIGMAGGVGVGGGWSAYVWMGLYGLSCLLDAFDGLAARYLDQSKLDSLNEDASLQKWLD